MCGIVPEGGGGALELELLLEDIAFDPIPAPQPACTKVSNRRRPRKPIQLFVTREILFFCRI
jgi:hypothetical protein